MSNLARAAAAVSLCVMLLAASPSPSPSPAASSSPSPAGSNSANKDPLDYSTLSHTISIDSLRAGSHDPSGVNEYFFVVSVYGLLNSTEERNAEIAKRKKTQVDPRTFGESKIESLSVWHPDEKLKNYKELRIEGQSIRELVARTMSEFKVPEGEVAVMVEIAMFEKNRRFYFFGEDTPISKISYYPIPATKFDTPIRTNQALVITDDKGTLVKIGVRYEK